MFRFRLRTLLIVLAICPPLLAGGYSLCREWREPRKQTIEGGICGTRVIEYRNGERRVISETLPFGTGTLTIEYKARAAIANSRIK